MGLAGLKTISILFLIVLVALAGGSPVFARDGSTFPITLTPTAACPGATVSISANIPIPPDVVGGGISIAAVSPLGIAAVVSSDPDGLIAEQECGLVRDTTVGTVLCTFVVSESASCGRYTVTVTLPVDDFALTVDDLGPSGSGIFDVAGSCCPAVGGCVQPVNTFALLSPWLAVIGLVGCIGTVAVVAKKRRP
jgi:hypothetical protein